MSVEEYLSQAYHLDRRIRLAILELNSLRARTDGLKSQRWDRVRVQVSRDPDARFVEPLIRALDEEKKVKAEIEELYRLKGQIAGVIRAVPDTRERMILTYRYVHGCTWSEIAEELGVNTSTAWRCHNRAIRHVVLPEKPVVQT